MKLVGPTTVDLHVLVTVATPVVRAGASFQVTGEGFTPGAEVQIAWDTASNDAVPAPVIATVAADSNGTIAALVRAPDGALTNSSALVVATGAGPEGTNELDAFVGVAAPCPSANASALVSATSLTLTNQFAVQGTDGNVHVTGDFTCNSDVHISGDVIATGNASLTNRCAVDGTVRARGTVSMNSQAHAGAVTAGGDVKLQSTNTVAGDIRAAGTVTTIDGVPLSRMQTTGAIGGSVTAAVTITPAAPDTWEAIGYNPAGDAPGARVLTWRQWMNAAASANGAPSWSQGLTSSPGCVMAPWGSSINGPTVTLDAATVIDARSVTSGCSSIALQQITLRVSADVTIYADQFTAVNGLKVLSADGARHSVKVLVPGSTAKCSASTGISLSAGTSFDPLLDVRLAAPGTVTFQDASAASGSVSAGCIAASGKMTLTAGAL